MSILNRPKGVLFDLDGTLVDTAIDLIGALNLALREFGIDNCDEAELRVAASHGSLYMVKKATSGLDNEIQKQIQQSMLRHYVIVNGEKGKLFPHLDSFLSFLNQNSIPYGIVTNKPARFTRPLIQKLKLVTKLGSIISCDSTTRQKPEIAPMLLAAQQIRCEPQCILYIGDARRDIEAANNSGMISAIAEWGYIDATDNINSWNADLLIKDPLDLLALFKNWN